MPTAGRSESDDSRSRPPAVAAACGRRPRPWDGSAGPAAAPGARRAAPPGAGRDANAAAGG